MNFKKIFFVFILLLISTCIPLSTFTARSTEKSNVVLNGKKLASYIQPATINGQLMVPLRKVCNIVGIKTFWFNNTEKITCIKGISKVELYIGSQDIFLSGAVGKLDAPPTVKGNTAYVPVSFPWEEFGIQILYNKAKNTISIKTGPIVFFGDSITQGFSLKKYFSSASTVNSGVSGNTTQDAIERLSDVVKSKPSKVFIMLGTNDIWENTDKKTTMDNYRFIIDTIQSSCPYSIIVVQSILPLGQNALNRNKLASNLKVDNLNSSLKSISKDYNLTFVDIGKLYKDNNGLFNNSYTSDGVHLKSKYYSIWAKSVSNLVKNPF